MALKQLTYQIYTPPQNFPLVPLHRGLPLKFSAEVRRRVAIGHQNLVIRYLSLYLINQDGRWIPLYYLFKLRHYDVVNIQIFIIHEWQLNNLALSYWGLLKKTTFQYQNFIYTFQLTRMTFRDILSWHNLVS